MSTTLVIGATGTVGRHVVELLSRGPDPVRALVRDPDRAAALRPGSIPVVGDLGDPPSLRAALDGVERVYLSCGNHPEQVRWENAAIDAAAAAGVRRIVKLSALGAATGSPVAFTDAHGRITEHLRASGVPHVLLEPAFLMSNLLAAAGGVRQAGALVLPGEGAKIAMIDPRDVARVAVAALHGDGHDGRSHVLTGPEAVTFDDVADRLSGVLGRPVGSVSVPDEAALGQLRGAGVPDWYAANLVAQFAVLRRGAQSEVLDAVRVLTGVDPRPVDEFLRDHAGAFAAA